MTGIKARALFVSLPEAGFDPGIRLFVDYGRIYYEKTQCEVHKERKDTYVWPIMTREKI